MATDYAQLAANLRSFYDFDGKVVLFVGAGGGQLLDPTVKPRKMIAIDHDVNALGELQKRLAAKRMQESFEIVCSRFEEVELRGDAVYFEFCLHEMPDPTHALEHARSLAPDIVVYDHSPGSIWAFYGAEEDKVCHSAEAMARFGIRRREDFHAEQRFRDYSELFAKISPQGPVAIERAQRYLDATNIVIPMDYGLTLL